MNAYTVVAVDTVDTATSKQYDSALGSAAVGALVAGPVGAAAGVVFSTRDRAGSLIEVRFRDGRKVLAAVSSAEHQALLKAVAPQPISPLEAALLWKNATPVTGSDGHQMLHGFLWQKKRRGQPELQVRLWDDRLEWDAVADNATKRPNISVSQIPLGKVDRMEASVTEGQPEGVLTVHAYGQRYDFPGPAYQVKMATKTYAQLLAELNDLAPDTVI
ncbi:hypothetical protein [Leifsonia sp. Leaf264]|uniref:hypothetical protein n=1 Tax=Leifsonia sp. Leaf264 TaxID=1736314 RepID=UPI0012FCED37|nr:hypothetical protein [Leifsonia sp. Leaf264]